MTKKKKTLGIVLLFLVLLVLLVIALNSTTNKWKNLMQDKAYMEAANVFSEDSNVNPHILKKELIAAIDNTKNEFRNHTLTYNDAIARLEILGTMNQESELINAAIEYVNRLNHSANAFAIAENKYNAGEYMQAIIYYQKVDPEDTNFNTASAKTNESLTAYRKFVISKADALQETFSYDAANSIIIEALEFFENDSELTNYQNVLCNNAVNYYEQKSFESVQKQDYLEAIVFLESAAQFNKPNEKEYQDQIIALYEKYFDLYLAKADAVFQVPKENYMDAASILEPLIKTYPNEAKLKAAYDYYLSFTPINLFEQSPYQKSTYFDASPSTSRLDNRGNSYEYMYTCGSIYVMDADWKLSQKYDRLTGVVGVPNGDYDTGVNGKIRIYGDGNLLWEKTGINASTLPEKISVDVSGVDVLQISMSGGSAPFRSCSVMVADFVVQKTNR